MGVVNTDRRQDYNNFHRIDIHKELLKSAFEAPGEGPKCELKVNFKAIEVNAEEGVVRFENGAEVSADIIVAADGIRVREESFCGISKLTGMPVPYPKHDWNHSRL